MTEDQSVVGRRRIYYDQNCGEALICSDSEEEIIEDEEDKKDFGSSEENVIRMTLQETGLSDCVVDCLAQCFDRKPSEIKGRCESLLKAENPTDIAKDGSNSTTDVQIEGKDLDAALDSFDNLFCRRCLVFDCRLHGCSQDLIYPSEKQTPWSITDEAPCGKDCYRLASKSKSEISSPVDSPVENHCESQKQQPLRKKAVSPVRRRSHPHQNERISPEDTIQESSSFPSNPKLRKGNALKKNNKRVAPGVLGRLHKRQKKMTVLDSDSISGGCLRPQKKPRRSRITRKYKKKESSVEEENEKDTKESVSLQKEVTAEEDESFGNTWKIFEKSLLEKGIEIFGRNSCLIARNLLSGMKTCSEVFQYMNFTESKAAHRAGDEANPHAEGHSKGGEYRRRSKFLRRRGRVRRLKYTWKSAGYHSIRKRISEKKDQPCRQYTPCNCKFACGKDCTCHLNGTCCEKYCGCSKTCKNRFRGCHCAKSQCRSRQCPCFAAGRECDPDVCRNCWVGCGDGTLGGPAQRGDNYECRNMKLLLKQQQRVLLGRSDVSGWGAFLKNSVNKHEYLGEYTGELISHREADKRGKIYDRENSSFLFNLNDQFVLDAYRKGDKLKFANHSPDPNCYAKVIMVAGDHRVGIFAKERINAGEELFYDYRYEPDRAPAWARRPETTSMKKEDTGSSGLGRAKKLA